MIWHRHGETADPGIKRGSLGHRPGAQDPADLDPQVEMQCRRVMKLHDEPGRRHVWTVPPRGPLPVPRAGPPRTLARDGADPAKGEQMTAYVIADINVHDQETYREYVALVPDTLKPHGGRFIVRGGASETLEGDWQPRRLVVIEFPSTDDARRWHGSPEYAPALAMRQRSATGNLVLVEGAE